MIPFICCLKKDITEIIRKKRLLLFNSLASPNMRVCFYNYIDLSQFSLTFSGKGS